MSSHDSGNNNKVNDDDAVTTDVDVVVASDNNDNAAGVSDCVSLTDQRVCVDRRAFTSALRDFKFHT